MRRWHSVVLAWRWEWFKVFKRSSKKTKPFLSQTVNAKSNWDGVNRRSNIIEESLFYGLGPKCFLNWVLYDHIWVLNLVFWYCSADWALCNYYLKRVPPLLLLIYSFPLPACLFLLPLSPRPLLPALPSSVPPSSPLTVVLHIKTLLPLHNADAPSVGRMKLLRHVSEACRVGLD